MLRSYPRVQSLARRALLFSLVVLPFSSAWAQSGTSTAENPTATFSTPGTKVVTLQACNDAGCTTTTQLVTVLDPLPKILSSSIPPLVGTGQTVTLQDSASGRPPLTHTWIFSSLLPDIVVTGSPVSWTAPLLPGDYQAHLEVSNVDGLASTSPVTVKVRSYTFADVPPTYWVWSFIENLYAHGVPTTCGDSPLLFCPDAPMTRGDMAVFLLRAKEGGSYAPPPCDTAVFDDVPCSDPLAPWINELVRRGVTAGCGGNNYCPTNPVTRDQMAVFLVLTAQGASANPDRTCPPAPFGDVPCTTPFYPWVKALVGLGVTAGCGNSDYCPGTVVSRAQMSVFLSVMFGLLPPAP
ncbi:MAG TPA: S-layer homology domain-containing protein [Thermoanaerobaculia bacterium]